MHVLGAIHSRWVNIINIARPVMASIDPNHNYNFVFRDSAGSRSKAVNILMNATQQQPVRTLVGEYTLRVMLGLALAALPTVGKILSLSRKQQRETAVQVTPPPPPKASPFEIREHVADDAAQYTWRWLWQNHIDEVHECWT